MKWSVLLAGITTVLGVLSALPALSQTPQVTSSAVYQCAEGKSFSAIFFDDKSMEATFGTKVFVLKPVPAASGARYSDGGVTVYTKGDEAFVEVGDKKLFTDCIAGSVPVQGMW
jgi:membrane-bound inhibitor of C-type lysozyme